MDFNVNAPILFVLVGIIVAFVLAQSAFFCGVRSTAQGKSVCRRKPYARPFRRRPSLR